MVLPAHPHHHWGENKSHSAAHHHHQHHLCTYSYTRMCKIRHATKPPQKWPIVHIRLASVGIRRNGRLRCHTEFIIWDCQPNLAYFIGPPFPGFRGQQGLKSCVAYLLHRLLLMAWSSCRGCMLSYSCMYVRIEFIKGGGYFWRSAWYPYITQRLNLNFKATIVNEQKRSYSIDYSRDSFDSWELVCKRGSLVLVRCSDEHHGCGKTWAYCQPTYQGSGICWMCKFPDWITFAYRVFQTMIGLLV